MPALVMVDDPLYQGPAPAPQLPRAWAMRKLHFEGGVPIGDVARRYGITYQIAYNAIKSAAPAAEPSAARTQSADRRQSPAAESPAAEASESAAQSDAAAASESAADPDDEPKPVRRTRPGPKLKTHTREELKQWDITKLKAAVSNRGLVAGSPYAKALEAELDAREPGWWDNL